MSTISSVSSQALQYVQTNLQTKNATQVKANTPPPAIQPPVPANGNDRDGDKDKSVGRNIDTFA